MSKIGHCVKKILGKLFICPIHQILFPIYVPLFIFSSNRYLFDLTDTIRPIEISAAIALCLFAALLFVYRNSHKAAVVTTVGLIIFYSTPLVNFVLPISLPGAIKIAFLTVIFLFVALLTWKARSVGPKLTMVLNAFFAALFILPIYKVATLEIRISQQGDTFRDQIELDNVPVADRPNIVHIVLDGYSRADVLKQLYRFDNSDFVRSLRALGFSVAGNSTTPYNQTLLVMNSVFSLKYINERVGKLSTTTDRDHLRLALNKDLQHSPLLKLLQSMKYSVISVESLYSGVRLGTADSTIASTDFRLGINLFEMMLLTVTPAYNLIHKLPLADPTYSQFKFSLQEHAIDGLQPPYFVYNHIIAPHPPFSVTPDGAYRPDIFGISDGSHRELDAKQRHANYRAGYIDKLQFTNRSILEMVRRLLDEVPDPKIVILHSDHGGGMYLNHNDWSRTCLKERFANFLAVYSSDPRLTDVIANQTNLVNLYRTILSEVFGANYPPLPSRNYFVSWNEIEHFELLDGKDVATFGPACS